MPRDSKRKRSWRRSPGKHSSCDLCYVHKAALSQWNIDDMPIFFCQGLVRHLKAQWAWQDIECRTLAVAVRWVMQAKPLWFDNHSSKILIYTQCFNSRFGRFATATFQTQRYQCSGWVNFVFLRIAASFNSVTGNYHFQRYTRM